MSRQRRVLFNRFLAFALASTTLLLPSALAKSNNDSAKPERNQMIQYSQDGTRPTSKGPTENFVGEVLVEPYKQAQEPSRLVTSKVTFSAGGRTAWHSHPLGQLLVVTEGTGFVQAWGEAPRVIKPGDVIWTPPGVKHWHGATATTKMSHLAILESLDGKTGDWMEHVSPEDFAVACHNCETK